MVEKKRVTVSRLTVLASLGHTPLTAVTFKEAWL
jgi:hypothetical protein